MTQFPLLKGKQIIKVLKKADFEVILFGYSRGMISSRSLERACLENITFMALACGQMPDHSTIAAFVSSLDNEIEPLFTKALLICEEQGLLGGTHFSMDGLKLSSNASKEWSGTFADLKKQQVVAHASAFGKGEDSMS